MKLSSKTSVLVGCFAGTFALAAGCKKAPPADKPATEPTAAAKPSSMSPAGANAVAAPTAPAPAAPPAPPTPPTPAQILAAATINLANWPALDCAADHDDANRMALLAELDDGLGDDGESFQTRVLDQSALRPSSSANARLTASCLASLKGDHATAKALLEPLAANPCTASVVALQQVAPELNGCAWGPDALALAAGVKPDATLARQLAAIKALRSGDAAVITKALAPTVTLQFACSICDESDPATIEQQKPKKLKAAAAAKVLGESDYHHLNFGRLIRCSETTCDFTGVPLSHSSSNVDHVTIDPKTGKITKITGVDG